MALLLLLQDLGLFSTGLNGNPFSSGLTITISNGLFNDDPFMLLAKASACMWAAFQAGLKIYKSGSEGGKQTMETGNFRSHLPLFAKPEPAATAF
jgi:hypothetical protein